MKKKFSKIPFFNIKVVNKDINSKKIINKVISSHSYILGSEVDLFEKEFSKYTRSNECISVANGTDALELSLRALKIKEKDKVAIVANAGFYSSSAVYSAGAIPIYVDIDFETMNMSSTDLLKIVKQKPKAIIVTHLYGQLADIEKISTIAKKNNIFLIEDCAQAHGASRNKKMAGTYGDIGCFSFYPTKNLGALGDAGAIITSNKKLGKIIRSLRQYGWNKKYFVDHKNGKNSRMDEIQASILTKKLRYLDLNNDLRINIANAYNLAFKDLPIVCPKISSQKRDFVAHLYVIRIDNRNSFCKFLKKNNIETAIHFPIPDHLQRAYKSKKIKKLNITETVAKNIVSLPCYPGMTNKQVKRVILIVKEFFRFKLK